MRFKTAFEHLRKRLNLSPGQNAQPDFCSCLSARAKADWLRARKLHAETQDEETPGWADIQSLIADSIDMAATRLQPAAHISWDRWRHVITLPADIVYLQSLKELFLYGSYLRRLPPEIGALSNLENLDIYTSYSLHWLPYEVTRCQHLRHSTMSTRALYGNAKTLLPFPRLSRPIAALLPATCSICNRRFGERSPQLWWTTQRVGADFAPLLIHSCSDSCTQSVPSSPPGYFDRPHKGGKGVGMPSIRI